MPRQPRETKSQRADRATQALRVDAILQLLLNGAARHDVLRHASENNWSIGERQIETYLAQAHAILAQCRERDRGRLIALHEAQRRQLYGMALQQGDTRTAASILRDLGQLQHVYDAEAVQTPPTAEPPPDNAALLRQLDASAPAALDALSQLSRCGDDTTRLQAARTLLDVRERLCGLAALEERLRALEGTPGAATGAERVGQLLSELRGEDHDPDASGNQPSDR